MEAQRGRRRARAAGPGWLKIDDLLYPSGAIDTDLRGCSICNPDPIFATANDRASSVIAPGPLPSRSWPRAAPLTPRSGEHYW